IDGRSLAPAVGFQLVLDALVLGQRPHAGTLYRADVDEGVTAAIFRGDEAVALVGVEKFDGADGHEMFPFHENEKPPRTSADGAGSVGKEGEPMPASNSVAGDVSHRDMRPTCGKVKVTLQ